MDHIKIIHLGKPINIALVAEIESGISMAAGERKLPSLCLYDDVGLQLFEDITYLPSYYLTNAEITVLETHADEMASCLKSHSILIELGSGNLRKTSILLNAIERQKKHIQYYALDVCQSELERSLHLLHQNFSYSYVEIHGICGTYDDARLWARKKSVCFLWLGSSIFNNTPVEIGPAVRSIIGRAALLVGFDSSDNVEKIRASYGCDPAAPDSGATSAFALNSLTHANHLLGWQCFEKGAWKRESTWDPDSSAILHELCCIRPSKKFQLGERIRLSISGKYAVGEMKKIWAAESRHVVKDWSLDGYHIQFVTHQHTDAV